MAGSATSSSSLHYSQDRSYDGLPNLEFGQLVKTLVFRGVIVGMAGTLAFLALRSMINDLMEEIRAGLV